MTTLLIDGDEYLFRACVANELDIRWDDYNHVLQANEEACWSDFAGSIDKLAQRFHTQDIKLCFSGTYDTPNFRLAIDPSYKASRQEKRKPLCYAALRSEADDTYSTQAFPGLEADDVMGILATKPGANCIIVSQDKDMKTIPAKIWTGDEVLNVTKEEADYWHMFQTLTGDAVDGFKGCPGMGPVGAKKILDNSAEEAVWRRVVVAYERKRLTEEDALRNARLARILRWDDWDRTKKQPKLWTPT
jgi:DNA polymerase-1